MAGVGLARELFERFLDLIGQVEQELGLPLDVGQRALKLGGGRRASPVWQPIGRFGLTLLNPRRCADRSD